MEQVKLEPGQKLSLTNDGQLEVFFIGAGGAFNKTLFQTNFLLIKGDHHVMVDFGAMAPRALWERAGLEITDLETVLFTHSHADHVGGAEAIAILNRYVGQRFMDKPKVKVVIGEEYQRILWDQTLRGGLEWNEEDGEGRKLCFSDYFDVIRPTWKTHQPREVLEAKIGDISIELFRTKHIPDSASGWEDSFVSYGLFVDGHVFFSADSRFDLELIGHYADRSEYMFHDVQFFPGGVHANLDELKTLSDEVKARMFLTHYGDNWAEQDISGFAGLTQEGVSYKF